MSDKQGAHLTMKFELVCEVILDQFVAIIENQSPSVSYFCLSFFPRGLQSIRETGELAHHQPAPTSKNGFPTTHSFSLPRMNAPWSNMSCGKCLLKEFQIKINHLREQPLQICFKSGKFFSFLLTLTE